MTTAAILRILAALLLVGYLPGALVFRLPIAGRERRAALAAEERAFWAVMLSAVWSTALVLGLAAIEQYTFNRLLALNGVVSLAALAFARGRLWYRGGAARMTWHAAIPIVLFALGVWRFFPPAEYIIGGKDPGGYVNAGVQIAQRGTIIIHDETAAHVPDSARELFFPWYGQSGYYSLRFMGFFLRDATSGDVIAQLPHFYPASIAIGYGMDGIRGARHVTGAWALLGLLALYFAGSRLVGRAAAAAAAALLAIHVIEMWFARCPNSDIVMQAMLFGGLLAFARAHQDDDGFFAPVAGLLLGLMVFLRVDALLAWVAVGTALVLGFAIARRPLRIGFLAPMAACAVLGAYYLLGPMRAYFSLPQSYLTHLPATGLAAGGVAFAGGVAALLWVHSRALERPRTLIPYAVIFLSFALVVDALVFRHTVGIEAPGQERVASHDAYALRTFVSFYLFQPGFAAALLGFALLVRRRFWQDPAFILTFVAFATYFFYKVRIVPEHFWMTRRWVPIILPGALLFVSTAALWTMRGPKRGLHLIRPVIGVAFLVLLGQQYMRASAPIQRHVEYAGMVRKLDALAANFGDQDLILIESRNAGSDLHVLGLPLDYIYGRHVLVLNPAKPDVAVFERFLKDALQRYARVFFIGGAGTALRSREIQADHVLGDHFRVPEYDSPFDAYPSGVRSKEFELALYQLRLGHADAGPFVLDVGDRDDLNVVRFQVKERYQERSVRWTGAQSFIEAPGLTGLERQINFVMSNAFRPAGAPPAHVEVLFDGTPIGAFDVTGRGFTSYALALPPALVAAAAARDAPAEITLRCVTWSPHEWTSSSDTRQLGVMVDVVEIH